MERVVPSERREQLTGYRVMDRRAFLKTAVIAGAGFYFGQGCAVNPVTGQKQLMLVSEQEEISIDLRQSPHQFSSDYGRAQDDRLQKYLAEVGSALAMKTHRPNMPYSFQCVNATYVNAYAFPGGSIAVTRGILLKLKDEAELAALLGHELGHVNARHSAEQMSKGALTSAIVSGAAVAAGSRSATLGGLVQTAGALGQGALLARYSRDNEREADSLGNQYMIQSGYSTQGFVGLMAILKDMNQHKASYTDLLFATHPMSDERYEAALERSRGVYAYTQDYTLNQERYMDETAALRKKQTAIEMLQKGEALMAQQKYAEAETLFRQALEQEPDDYAGNVMLSQSLLVQEKLEASQSVAQKAQQLYPEEPFALQLGGICSISLKQYEQAFQQFEAYEKRLPGNPTITFFMGYSLEGINAVDRATQKYKDYLEQVQQGKYAEHAYNQLKAWGAL